MRLQLVLRVYLLLSLLAFGLGAQQAPVPQANPRSVAEPHLECARSHLRTFMEKRRIPGLSIAVGHGGQLVWAEAFGVSDLESKTPLTPSVVFPLGSTSKAMTSLALGKLVEDRKLDLDAPIQTYVPYFPEKEHRITPRLLAGHLAGLRDYDLKTEYYNDRDFPSVQEAVGVFKNDPLLFEPGTKHAYSAYNFVLLSAAIEGASGQNFLSFMNSRIFTPLGLTQTGPDRRPAEMPGMVSCYLAGFLGIPAPAKPINVSNKWAAGGFASTPTEMVRLGNAVLQDQVVRPETFALLIAPQKLKNGDDSGARYGMGWRSWREKLPLSGREVLAAHHGGVAHGAMSFFVLFPEVDLVLSININLHVNPFSDLYAEAFYIADLFLPPAPGCTPERQAESPGPPSGR
jgi:serine beta-lactamase-like protein LACTB, mitochondrial